MPALEQFQYIQDMIDENQHLTVRDVSQTPPSSGTNLHISEIPDKISLQTALEKRTAVRDYSSEPVHLEDLKVILGMMKNLDRQNWPIGDQLDIAIDFSIIVRNVTQLSCPAIYHYRPQSNDFELIYDIPENEDKDAWFLQKEFIESPAVIIVHGQMANALQHFNEHGYRHLMTRGGAAVHNAWLASLTLGYAGSIFAGTLPAPLKKYTAIDGDKQVQLCAFSLGKALF